MLNINKKKIFDTELLYNKIVSLSREKYLYTEIKLEDSFNGRINLIFLHFSFLFVRFKSKSKDYKDYNQHIFDHLFKQIDMNLREMGFGDVSVNKKMKKYINHFYNVLLKSENYKNMTFDEKMFFLKELFNSNRHSKIQNLVKLVEYFDQFFYFTSNLTFNDIQRGNINFHY